MYIEDMTFNEGFLEPLDRAALANPKRIFACSGNRQLTLGEAREASSALASALIERGVKPGDRVAIMAANGLVTIISAYAIARVGAVWLALDPSSPELAITRSLAIAEPVFGIAEEKYATSLQAVWPGEPRSLVLVHDLNDVSCFLKGLRAKSPATRKSAPPPTAPFMLIGTSGTTGRPKLAIVTHKMMGLAAIGVIQCADLQDGDRLYVWEPFWHIGGAQLLAVAAFREVILWLAPGFDPGRFWNEVREARATHIHYLGGILHFLARQPDGPHDRSHCVRVGWGAGATPALAETFSRRFGIELHEAYGLTEAASISTCSNSSFDGSLGRPVSWASIAILDSEGCALPPGHSGEIVIRENGIPYFAGYFGDPEATVRVFRSTGLHTGDRGRFDGDGRLYYEGRVTDVFRCRGQNVSAWEVESVAVTHPDVEDCAVTAAPGDLGDQDLVLSLKSKPNAALDFQDLTAWLTERLAPAQRPRYYRLVAEFQRTPSQRIIKARLPVTLSDCYDRFAELAPDERQGTPVQVIERVWRRILRRSPSEFSNFAAAGGDSLAFVRMTLLVEKATGLRPPLDRCHPGMSLAEFVKALEMAPMPIGGGPVVALLPGAVGDSPLLAEFRRDGGVEFAWFTLVYPGWRKIVTDRLEARRFISCLVDQVAQAGLQNPLCLVGYSSGSALAFALACVLREQGRVLAPVILIDGAAASSRTSHVRIWQLWRADARRRLLRILARWCTHNRTELYGELVVNLTSRICAFVFRRRRSRFIRELAASRLALPDLGIDIELRLDSYFRQRLAEESLQAISQGVQTIHVALMRSGDGSAEGPEDLGWASVAQVIRLERFDADHYNILQGENGSRIRAILREVRMRSDQPV